MIVQDFSLRKLGTARLQIVPYMLIGLARIPRGRALATRRAVFAKNSLLNKGFLEFRGKFDKGG